MFYWILAWTLANDAITFESWGTEFALGIIQDVFINMPVKIFVVHVAIIQVVRPQLRQISNVLKGVALDTMADEFDGISSSVTGETLDVRVVQYLSASCRASRTLELAEIPAAKLLSKLGDYHLVLCREMRYARIGVMVLSVAVIPMLLALGDERVQDIILDIIIPAVWNSFLIFNITLLDISPGLLTLPYLALATYIMYQIYMRRRVFRRFGTPAKPLHGLGGIRNKPEVNGKGKKKRPTVSKVLEGVDLALLRVHVLFKKEKQMVDLIQDDLIWRNMNHPFRLNCVTRSGPATSSSPRGSVDDLLLLLSAEHIPGSEKAEAGEAPIPDSLVRSASAGSIPNSLPTEASPKLIVHQNTFSKLLSQHSATIDNLEYLNSGSERGPGAMLTRDWLVSRREENNNVSLTAARYIFAALDVDLDGRLDGEDLERLAAWIWETAMGSGDTPTTAELDEAMDFILCSVDVNCTGVIDFQAFYDWYLAKVSLASPHA